MKAKRRPRFDLDALRKQAGGKIFERGKEYFHDGCVDILSLEANRVVAVVAGTEDYRTVVSGGGGDIDGECSCPAFRDWGFCKHMVAAALAANAAGDDSEAAGALPRIRQHLRGKTIEELANMIVELAEQNPELFRKLDMASSLMQADDKTLEVQLRRAIDESVRTVDYMDYRQAQRWQAGVTGVLDALFDLASGARAGIALRLIEYAIECIEEAFEAIDDSDGHIGALLDRARDIHLAAAEVVRPEPVALARDLFRRETEDDFYLFEGAVERYADVLGEKGLAEYRRLATAAWDKLPARAGGARAASGSAGPVDALHGILDFFARQAGDVDARIALRAKNIESPWDYLQLVELCLSSGREAEALRRSEEALWLFEDGRPDEKLLLIAVRLLIKARRKDDAEAHLWRAFEKWPSLELYERICEIGGKPGMDRALALLESGLSNGKRLTGLGRSDLLVEILAQEKRFGAAWEVVRKFDASIDAKDELARASGIQFPREALEFYAGEVERLANQSGYVEAAELITRMAKLRSKAEQAVYLADIKARHGRKRNFMKLLG